MDDDDDAELPRGAPLPPDDRLWRHPSEVGAEGGKQQIVIVSKGSSLGRTLAVAGLAGLIGAAATLAVVAGTDAFVRERKGDTAYSLREVPPPRAVGQSELAIADKVLPSVARVEATGPNGVVNGTAVVFRNDGELITTADLVDASQIVVYLSDGTKLAARVVGRSLDADIAILKVDRDDLPVAVGTKRKVAFGDLTVMIDASKPTRGPDITVGVVTKETTSVTRGDDKPAVYGVIQTTTRASVTPRSAGSLLIDSGGTVIGFITSRAEPPAEPSAADTPTTTAAKAVSGQTIRDTTVDEGNALHFALPADFAWDIAAQLADKGEVVKPWMGLRGGDISREEANQLGTTGGMRVTFVEDASPSRTARLRVDDVIVGLDDENIRGYNDWLVALRRHKPGDQVKITFMRDQELEAALATVAGKTEQP